MSLSYQMETALVFAVKTVDGGYILPMRTRPGTRNSLQARGLVVENGIRLTEAGLAAREETLMKDAHRRGERYP